MATAVGAATAAAFKFLRRQFPPVSMCIMRSWEHGDTLQIIMKRKVGP
jgi:hypothetical protein